MSEDSEREGRLLKRRGRGEEEGGKTIESERQRESERWREWNERGRGRESDVERGREGGRETNAERDAERERKRDAERRNEDEEERNG